MVSTTVRIPLQGPYDLREVALMGFGHRDEQSFDGVMRLGFCVDGDLESQVGVALRQDGDSLSLDIQESAGPPVDPGVVAAQVARVVSADHDARPYEQLCLADPFLAPFFRRAPGFRPANFYSPYEAAVWSILSARRARGQGIGLRDRLARDFGTVFTVAGEQVPVVPIPARLLELEAVPGLPADRIPRLHAVAEAAQRGDLDLTRLTSMTPEEAMEDLQRLPGIGPFYSSLITIRGCGLTDVLATEPQALQHLTQAYGRQVDAHELARIAEAWRPWRTWVLVMLRALGDRPPAEVDRAGG